MTARRGRKPGFVMTDEHRTKIRNSAILNALIEHVEGKREMSSSQVSAGLGLLKKVLPDLSAVEYKAEPPVDALSELMLEISEQNRSLLDFNHDRQ